MSAGSDFPIEYNFHIEQSDDLKNLQRRLSDYVARGIANPMNERTRRLQKNSASRDSIEENAFSCYLVAVHLVPPVADFYVLHETIGSQYKPEINGVIHKSVRNFPELYLLGIREAHVRYLDWDTNAERGEPTLNLLPKEASVSNIPAEPS